MSAEHDKTMVREALRLEREAAARYSEHPAASSDPSLVTYWESLRRNEAEHRRLLEAWLRAHGEDPDADPPEVLAEADATGVLDAASTREGGAGRHPLAPGGTGGRGHAGDLAALRSDYDFEDEAVAIYGHFAYRAGDPDLTGLFKELARGEAGHRNGLRRTIRTVRGPGHARDTLLPTLRVGHRLRPRPRGGHGGQVRDVPGTVRAAARRSRRLDTREAGSLR